MTPEEMSDFKEKHPDGYVPKQDCYSKDSDDAGGVDMSTVSKKDLLWVGDELSALAFKCKDGAKRMYLYGLFYSLYKDLK